MYRIRRRRTEVVAYAQPFPAPRTERVAPGHLVAVAPAADGSDVVIWRWYDAVVLEGVDGIIRPWESAHGTVLAQPRDRKQIYRPGGRAYLSAGLPGAEAVKARETRRGHAVCMSCSVGGLIQATVGSFGGMGRLVNRIGLAA